MLFIEFFNNNFNYIILIIKLKTLKTYYIIIKLF